LSKIELWAKGVLKSNSWGIGHEIAETHNRCWLPISCEGALNHGYLSMGFLVAPNTNSNRMLGCVITQAIPRLNVMDLKTLYSSARLVTPATSLQDLASGLAIGFGSNSRGVFQYFSPRLFAPGFISNHSCIDMAG
jgi:hypothetical protein